jgi:hypothetical protein
MRTVKVCILSCTILTLLATSAFAEVRITLKNGRSFIADFCRETDGKFVCDMQGGTMEIDRNDIANIKDVKMQKQMIREEAPEAAQAEEKKQPETPEAEKKEPPAQNEEGKLVRGLTPEQAEKIDQLNEKKAAMKAERDSLAKDRDQLYEDVKNTGVVRNQEQIDEIKKRIADLERRINVFNEAVKKLNAEEELILKR